MVEVELLVGEGFDGDVEEDELEELVTELVWLDVQVVERDDDDVDEIVDIDIEELDEVVWLDVQVVE